MEHTITHTDTLQVCADCSNRAVYVCTSEHTGSRPECRTHARQWAQYVVVSYGGAVDFPDRPDWHVGMREADAREASPLADWTMADAQVSGYYA